MQPWACMWDSAKASAGLPLLAAQVTHQRMAQQVAWCNEDLPFLLSPLVPGPPGKTDFQNRKNGLWGCQNEDMKRLRAK